MKIVYYNPNPTGKNVGDCTIRALSKALDQSWEETYIEIARKPEMNAGDLETIHKLTDTIKNIDKIYMLESSDGYSRASNWEMEGRDNYKHGNSYARARDSKGRYEKSPRYSRSGAKERMIDQLEDMLDDTHSDKERDAICRCIEQLEKA